MLWWGEPFWQGGRMGWEHQLVDLFEELESQAGALYDAERAPEIADRSRAEYRTVTLASRLMASRDRMLMLEVVGVGPVQGRLDRVGEGWVLLSGAGQDWAVALDAVGGVQGASSRAVPEVAWPTVARLGLASVLRRLAEEEAPCVLHLRSGGRREGPLVRVGHDFVEVRGAEDGLCLVTFSALAAVQSRD